MTRTGAALTAVIALILSGGSVAPPPQQNAAASPEADVIVTGLRDIVVNGRARRCHPLAGDPLGRIDLATTMLDRPLEQSVVKPDGHGHYLLLPDDEPLTGPETWQRAGRGLDQYLFRTGAGDLPICIGALLPDHGSFGQLRRIVDARAYHGHRVRFTAWVASGNAGDVRFWLAAGYQTRTLYNGGNTNNRHWGGSHGWTPVMLEIGPIDKHVDHLSYGFMLQGQGDVWVYRPELTIVADNEPFVRTGDVSVIGHSER